MSDFPTHDMAADFVLLAEQRQVESDLKEQYEVGEGRFKDGATKQAGQGRCLSEGQYRMYGVRKVHGSRSLNAYINDCTAQHSSQAN